MLKEKKMKGTDFSVSLLCKFWFEDGVWNGITEDLAVAVFENTFEEAMANLRSAIKSHMEALIEAGEVKDLVPQLEQRAKDYGFLSLEKMSPDSPLVKMSVVMKNGELVAVN